MRAIYSTLQRESLIWMLPLLSTKHLHSCWQNTSGRSQEEQQWVAWTPQRENKVHTLCAAQHFLPTLCFTRSHQRRWGQQQKMVFHVLALLLWSCSQESPGVLRGPAAPHGPLAAHCCDRRCASAVGLCLVGCILSLQGLPCNPHPDLSATASWIGYVLTVWALTSASWEVFAVTCLCFFLASFLQVGPWARERAKGMWRFRALRHALHHIASVLARHQTALLVSSNWDSPGFALLHSILREGNLLIKLNMHIAHLFFKNNGSSILYPCC